jgi:hypothetical protein
MYMKEHIWFRDPSGFITSDNFAQFVPLPSTPYERQLNSILRFAVYFALIMLLIRRDATILWLPVMAMGFTWFMYNMYENENASKEDALNALKLGWDKKRKRVCVLPSEANPFMNVLVNEYKEAPKRPAACDILDPKIKADVQKKFNKYLWRDAGDIFENQASDRQFYTTPVTTIPNDQGAFAEWTLKPPPTCKERTVLCYRGRQKGV